MKPAAMAALLAAACKGDSSPSGTDPTDTATATATSSPTPGAQGSTTASIDEPPGLPCLDDYPGHEAIGSPLAVEVRRTAVELGDGLASTPVEAGSDRLAVCSEAPSDFFVLQAACSGYLVVELRGLDTVPDLVLYDGAGQPLEQLLGTWEDFDLKPLQRRVEAGDHVLEVRHTGSDAQQYSLLAFILSDSTCH